MPAITVTPSKSRYCDYRPDRCESSSDVAVERPDKRRSGADRHDGAVNDALLLCVRRGLHALNEVAHLLIRSDLGEIVSPTDVADRRQRRAMAGFERVAQNVAAAMGNALPCGRPGYGRLFQPELEGGRVV